MTRHVVRFLIVIAVLMSAFAAFAAPHRAADHATTAVHARGAAQLHAGAKSFLQTRNGFKASSSYIYSYYAYDFYDGFYSYPSWCVNCGTLHAAGASSAIGGAALSNVVVDMDDNGTPDVVTANNSANSVTVRFGTGTGTFTGGASYSTGGTGAWAIASGQFNTNSDYMPDIVVTNEASGSISVFLNNGSGGLNAATVIPIPYGTASANHPRGVAVGDFNDDGKDDIAVTSWGTSVLSIWTGNGDGTFTHVGTESPIYINDQLGKPWGIVADDFDGDGNDDLAIAFNAVNQVERLVSNGDGTFAYGGLFSVGTGPRNLGVGDVSGDGWDDIAVSNYGSSNVSLITGSFGPPTTVSQTVTVGGPTNDVAIGYFNCDNYGDLAVVVGSQLKRFLNNSGLFNLGSVNYTIAGTGSWASVADVDGDSLDDIVANGSSALTVLLDDETPFAYLTVDNSVPPFISTNVLPVGTPATITINGFTPGWMSHPWGNGPFTVKWSDGVINTFAAFPFTRQVTPPMTTSYSLNYINGVSCNNGEIFQNNITVNIDPNSTMTTLTATPSASVLGQNVLLKATVKGGDGTTVTVGTVDFFVDGSLTPINVSPASLATGTASYTTNALTLGPHTIVARYNPGGSYTISYSAPVNVTVGQGQTTTTVTSNLNPSPVGGTVNLTATTTAKSPATGTPSGGTWTFKDGANAIVGCNPVPANGNVCSVASLAAGVHTITAIYSGDANFLGSTSAGFTQTVTSPSNVALILFAGTNPNQYGVTPLKFRATVTSSGGTPTGSVQFLDGANPLVTVALVAGVATTADITTLPVGVHSLTAKYIPTGAFAAATSAPLSQTITLRAYTSLILSATPASPQPYGVGTLTVTLTVPAGVTPSGGVTFMDGATAIRTVSLAGSGVTGTASIPLSLVLPGVHSFTAVYAGSATVAGGTSNTVPYTTTQGLTHTTVTSSTGGSSVYGQPVTFAAHVTVDTGVGIPTGTVTFTSNIDGPIGTVTVNGANNASLTLNSLSVAGHTITAHYNGDAKFAASSPDGTVGQTVSMDGTSIVMVTPASNANKVVGQGFTVAAKVTALAPGVLTPNAGNVNFYEQPGNTLVGTFALNAAGVASGTISSCTIGPKTYTATYLGDGTNYTGSGPSLASTGTITITVASTSLSGAGATFTGDGAGHVYVGETITYTAATIVPQYPVPSCPGAPLGTVTYYDITATPLTTDPVAAGSPTAPSSYSTTGLYTIAAYYPGNSGHPGGDPNFAPSIYKFVISVIQVGTTAVVTNPTGAPSLATGTLIGFTANVTANPPASIPPSSGNIQFDITGDVIDSGTVAVGSTFNWTAPYGGTFYVTVTYLGDGGNYAPSATSASESFTVGAAAVQFTNYLATANAAPGTLDLTVDVTGALGTTIAPADGTLHFHVYSDAAGTTEVATGTLFAPTAGNTWSTSVSGLNSATVYYVSVDYSDAYAGVRYLSNTLNAPPAPAAAPATN